METHLHHVHIFASDLDKSIRFYEDFFGGRVALDMELAGARNVFMRVGRGRIHFYDQPPKVPGRASIHHFGIQTDDIEGIVERLRSAGVVLRKGVADFGLWRYIMVPAPDDILVELFEVDKDKVPPDLRDYFE
ncbi:MAG: VOC family protein [Deltaproteobacteria bacterium]|uniref:VOC family protein n=1 Tax=Candidatus Zymogenus saltonus TaxID=2844893 RepID=A0A9D8PRI2_9DELT|nr:VOC family protein [Candidatus Zymogenus saltonus]